MVSMKSLNAGANEAAILVEALPAAAVIKSKLFAASFSPSASFCVIDIELLTLVEITFHLVE